jgi:capsular polysaccharide biosynthesis protein
MELREYGRILRRHLWLILLLPLLAGLFSLMTREEPTISYGYHLQYSVSFMPVPRDNMSMDPNLGAVQASEYVADDLTQIFEGSLFASYVQQYLPTPRPTGAITGATLAEKTHRMVNVSLSGATSEEVTQLATAVKQAATSDLDALVQALWGTTGMRMELVDEVGPVANADSLGSRLDLPLRVTLALIAAVALAFALDYLDDSVRSRKEVEQLVGPVLGEIPS